MDPLSEAFQDFTRDSMGSRSAARGIGATHKIRGAPDPRLGAALGQLLALRQAVAVHVSVEPDRAKAGDEVVVALLGPDSDGWIGGLYAEFEEEAADGWRTVLHLTGIPVGRGGEFPPPVPGGQTQFEHSVGVSGPIRFAVPEVPLEKYRVSRGYVQPGLNTNGLLRQYPPKKNDFLSTTSDSWTASLSRSTPGLERPSAS
jgi:hypothetical protein